MISVNEIAGTTRLFALLALVFVGGCNQSLTSSRPLLDKSQPASPALAPSVLESDEAPQPPEGLESQSDATRSDPVSQTSDSNLPPAPHYVYEPKVLLSDAHRATCLIGVGDVLPELSVMRRSGETAQLLQFSGEKLTVVVFWSAQSRFGREQISRLPQELVTPFSKYGVKVVTINSEDSVEQLSHLVPTDEAAGFEVLLDTDGQAIGKLATNFLPRTYLLDPDGKVLWFDLGYSRSSVRELNNAIHFFLGNRTANDG